MYKTKNNIKYKWNSYLFKIKIKYNYLLAKCIWLKLKRKEIKIIKFESELQISKEIKNKEKSEVQIWDEIWRIRIRI